MTAFPAVSVRIPPGVGVGGGAVLDLIARLPAWSCDLVQLGYRSEDRYDHPDNAAAAACRALVSVGATDDDIVDVFRAHPRGIGAFLCSHDKQALQRVITFARQGTLDDTLVHIVQVESSGERRTQLEVEVLDGARAGQRFVQDLWHGSGAWRWVFEHAGLVAPARHSTEAAQALAGRTVGAHLEVHAPDKLRVKRWLAPSAVKAAREHYVALPAPGTWTPPPGPECPWDIALHAMAARGVRVDPVRWEAAVGELRAQYTAQAQQGDRKAQDRLIQLEAYGDVVLQAALTDPENRVRAVWRAGSWSLRITTSRPNLQSITKDGGLRAAVVPAPGHCSLGCPVWLTSEAAIVA